MTRIGYACINMTLAESNITTNRGMVLRTFKSKGLDYVSELVIKNLTDLYKIVEWNNENGIKAFRISSELFPWNSEYNLEDLPNYEKITELASAVGRYSISNDIRLSCHPGPFNILGSPKSDVVQKTLHELGNAGKIFDLMGLHRSPYNKINIHIGGVYGDKSSAISRFKSNFQYLDYSARTRLTIENDDIVSKYSVEDLIPIAQDLNIPVVFDFHHYDCHPGNLTKEQALLNSLATWPVDITPMTHYSNSRKKYEDPKCKPQAHADYLYEPIPYLGQYKFDVMIEAKCKELALIKYKNEILSTNTSNSMCTVN